MASAYVITAPQIPTLPVDGTDALFPVHRIYCVGRNFADHAIEMGTTPRASLPSSSRRTPTISFWRTARARPSPYPARSSDVHYEIEMVVALKAGGENIPLDQALDCVYGYGVGIDLTRRDLQGEAKKLGRPWEVGKAFEQSAPATTIIPAAKIGHPSEGRVWLSVNGAVKQDGNLNQMIWKVPEMISELSTLFRLQPAT